MKKLFALLLIGIMILGCSSNKKENVAAPESSAQPQKQEEVAQEEVTQEEPVDIPTKKELTLEDLEITEYKVEVLNSTEYVLAIKNNSELTAELHINATAYDAEGNMIGSDNGSIDVIGAGEQSCMHLYFMDVTGIDHIEYEKSLQYTTNTLYDPVLNNLSVQENCNGDVLTLAVTNNGDKAAMFVEAYAIFMDAAGNPLQISNTYIVDSNHEIAPGAMVSAQLSYYSSYDKGAYDHVTWYLTGRAEK